MPRTLELLMNERAPVRAAIRKVLSSLEIGSFEFRYRLRALNRMHYAYIMWEAAKLAAQLGEDRISAIEFGVAGGNGLLWMEKHAEQIENVFPVKIEIYGFDTGQGLPPPKDYRDLPYHWSQGFYRMDQPALSAKLKRAKLILGDVSETLRRFRDDFQPAPIGAVAFDLDFYSSTKGSLHLLEAPTSSLMPRIFCYFDDTVGTEVELYSDYTGERLAIHEFNETHENRKIAIPYYLRVRDGLEAWPHQIWIAHLFAHPRYNDFVGVDNQQRPIK